LNKFECSVDCRWSQERKRWPEAACPHAPAVGGGSASARAMLGDAPVRKWRVARLGSFAGARLSWWSAQFVRRWTDLSSPRSGTAGEGLIHGGGVPAAKGVVRPGLEASQE